MNSTVLSAAKSLLVAVGVTGTLVATGYIIESSYQDLLGIEIQYLSSLAYLLSAARFLIDLFTVILRWLEEEWTEYRIWVVVAALVLAGVPFLPRLRRVSARAERVAEVINIGIRRLRLLPSLPHGSIVLIFMVLCVWKMAKYDLPWVWVENALVGTADFNRTFGPSESIQQRVAPLWALLLCSHRPTPGREDKKLELLHSRCREDQTLFVREMNDTFFREIALTSFLIGLGFLVLSFSHQKDDETHDLSLNAEPLGAAASFGAHNDLRKGQVTLGSVIVAIFLILNVLSVPYVYGKTIRLNSLTRHASISYTVGQSPGQKEGYILAQSDKEMVFVDGSGRRDVFYLPMSEVTLVQVSNVEDVFEYYIRSTNGEAPAPAPSPQGN